MILELSDNYNLDKYILYNTDYEEKFYAALSEHLRLLKLNGYAIGVPDAGDTGQICLHKEGALWVVYISERGKRRKPSFFSHSWDAANFLIWELLSSKNNNIPRYCPDLK